MRERERERSVRGRGPALRPQTQGARCMCRTRSMSPRIIRTRTPAAGRWCPPPHPSSLARGRACARVDMAGTFGTTVLHEQSSRNR